MSREWPHRSARFCVSGGLRLGVALWYHISMVFKKRVSPKKRAPETHLRNHIATYVLDEELAWIDQKAVDAKQTRATFLRSLVVNARGAANG